MRDYKLLDLIAINHLILAQLQGVEIAVDMTVGNGHDTLFLAQHFPRVIGFDIQRQAIENARTIRFFEHVSLFCDDHYNVDKYLSAADLFLFNLGWLPGSNKLIATQADRICPTLDKCTKLLRTGGLISIIAYRGDATQKQEDFMIREWLSQQTGFYTQVIQPFNNDKAPTLYLLALKKTPR